MDKKHQMSLLLGAAKDYQDGLMPLGMLIDKVEGVLEILQDVTIKNVFFDDLLAIEEVYARTRAGGFDFQKDGSPVVDRAVKEVLIKAEAFLQPVPKT